MESIKRICDWLGNISQPGLSQLLDRLGISWKRSREHVHSPDPDYEAKLDYIIGLCKEARSSSGRIILLYQDELTYYRQPTLANAWEERGHTQALAERSHQWDTPTRVSGTLNIVDGQVLHYQGKMVGITELVGLYKSVRETYAGAERIYVVQDNWPVHFHPDVLVALEPQVTHWPDHHPKNWPNVASEAATRKWADLKLPIQLIRLPTYASWTNPIEKLWRKLKQELLHLHKLADHLQDLREMTKWFLDKFALGSLELLLYVGLLTPG